MTTRRLWAAAALGLAVATIALAIATADAHFPNGLSVLACLILSGAAATYGVPRHGRSRTAALTAAAVLLAGAVVLVFVEHRLLDDLLVLAGVAGTLAAARLAFRPQVE